MFHTNQHPIALNLPQEGFSAGSKRSLQDRLKKALLVQVRENQMCLSQESKSQLIPRYIILNSLPQHDCQVAMTC